MRKLNHLYEIHKFYDTFVIDLWGVMHNGIELNSKAIEAVDNLIKNNKKVVFLSNAPRPSAEVKLFLNGLKMESKYLEHLVTSGEAAKEALRINKFGKYFYHLGPEKDKTLFFDIKENRTSLEKCDFIVCTGLFDENPNDINYYKKLLKKYVSKQLICTNPDLTVHRGKKEEYCAGAIAEIFESMGGKVVYFGKPYKEIYKMCFKKEEKVIAIGDNLRTDIKGANNVKIDSVFILSGVHRSEFKKENELPELCNKYKVKINYFQEQLSW